MQSQLAVASYEKAAAPPSGFSQNALPPGGGLGSYENKNRIITESMVYRARASAQCGRRSVERSFWFILVSSAPGA
jgi:hypothetical protein